MKKLFIAGLILLLSGSFPVVSSADDIPEFIEYKYDDEKKGKTYKVSWELKSKSTNTNTSITRWTMDFSKQIEKNKEDNYYYLSFCIETNRMIKLTKNQNLIFDADGFETPLPSKYQEDEVSNKLDNDGNNYLCRGYRIDKSLIYDLFEANEVSIEIKGVTDYKVEFDKKQFNELKEFYYYVNKIES